MYENGNLCVYDCIILVVYKKDRLQANTIKYLITRNPIGGLYENHIIGTKVRLCVLESTGGYENKTMRSCFGGGNEKNYYLFKCHG